MAYRAVRGPKKNIKQRLGEIVTGEASQAKSHPHRSRADWRRRFYLLLALCLARTKADLPRREGVSRAWVTKVTQGNRPALKRLLADVEVGKVDRVVVPEVSRLSRSLPDFIRIKETFDQNNVALVSVEMAGQG